MKIEYKILSHEEMKHLPEGAHPKIRFRLLNLNLSAKQKLFEEFGSLTEAELDDCVSSIERTLYMYLYWNNRLSRFNGMDMFTSRTAKQVFSSLQMHLSEAHKLLTEMDDLTIDQIEMAVGEEDEDQCGHFNGSDFRYHTLMVAKAAAAIEEAIQPTRGRPARDDLLDALQQLGIFYEHMTGHKPGYSSPPEQKPGSSGQDRHGPFVRFATRILKIVERSDSAVDNAIRRYVGQEKRSEIARREPVEK
ncbi:hypothetical protein [Labrenzia sp. R5_0]|jgi:hypothetical protein|uniref:hypothetical protein n=1 Tax=Labrenzia sp. R5_0 TaxID=2821108 RepID=UPI001ADD5CA3|nr:hypothetical protein [Labrenzia sp. R5_0]MBO9461694.1 hypothetical protein [Labrenzia sp. R5_0]